MQIVVHLMKERWLQYLPVICVCTISFDQQTGCLKQHKTPILVPKNQEHKTFWALFTSIATPGWSSCESMSIFESGYLRKSYVRDLPFYVTWCRRCPHRTWSGVDQQELRNLLDQRQHLLTAPTPVRGISLTSTTSPSYTDWGALFRHIVDCWP